MAQHQYLMKLRRTKVMRTKSVQVFFSGHPVCDDFACYYVIQSNEILQELCRRYRSSRMCQKQRIGSDVFTSQWSGKRLDVCLREPHYLRLYISVGVGFFDVSSGVGVGMCFCGVCPCSEFTGPVGPPIPHEQLESEARPAVGKFSSKRATSSVSKNGRARCTLFLYIHGQGGYTGRYTSILVDMAYSTPQAGLRKPCPTVCTGEGKL